MLDKLGHRSSCSWKADRELSPKEIPSYGPTVTLLHTDLTGLRHNLVERPLRKTLLKAQLWGEWRDPWRLIFKPIPIPLAQDIGDILRNM